MDRRQRKTREAIFSAFTELLNEKNFNQITVSDIIDRADIGRATFYAHFETKDFLLKELCGELFCHIFDSSTDTDHEHRHIFNCNSPDSVFKHLFEHLYKNDNQILELLSSENNELFLRYFKINLIKLVETQLETFSSQKARNLPQDFYINHIAATFVETARWWVENKLKQTPQEITEYFLAVVGV
ncbi:MAG: TetR/AcrR family transcriptional regulator [Ruminococcus sp.]|nr:TetR/AcrR family transcriptional regulator [Ruminococcus sp.]